MILERLVSEINTEVLGDIRSEYFEKCLDILFEYGKTGRILVEYVRNTSSQAGPKTSDYFRTLGAYRSVFCRILTRIFDFWRSVIPFCIQVSLPVWKTGFFEVTLKYSEND